MFKNILIFIFFFVISTFIVYEILNSQNITTLHISLFEPKTQFSIQNAPSQSLKGKTINLSGAVSYQSRAANFGLSITTQTDIVQGDSLSTLGNGKALVIFGKIGNVSLLPNTQVNFIQTLPQNFVVQQTEGLSIYQRAGKIPFTVRAFDLIVDLSDNSSVSIGVDKDKSIVTIDIQKGIANLAFTDLNNVSNVVNLTQGEKAIFNNNTQSLNLQ